MTVRLAMSVVAVALTGAAVCAAQPIGRGVAGTAPTGTYAEQTFPRLAPRTAKRASRVAVFFTLADQPGHAGVTATSYRVQIDAPIMSRAACRAAAPPVIDSGSRGAVIRVPLPRPRHGWCVGRYKVIVYLQRGPYCPAPAPGQPPQPCPLFATQDLDVGHAHLTVRAASH